MVGRCEWTLALGERCMGKGILMVEIAPEMRVRSRGSEYIPRALGRRGVYLMVCSASYAELVPIHGWTNMRDTLIEDVDE